MTELSLFDESPEEENSDPQIETPVDLRPDLTKYGLQEVEKGVVEDTYENRQALRQASMHWDTVYSQTGQPTGLISARTQEMDKQRRMLSLEEKKPLLSDPRDPNSDYVTGYDLIVEEEATRVTPPWVIGATKTWMKEQERGGPTSQNRAPAALPHRCKMMKTDGLRCMLWSSGRIKDDGLCRVHLRSIRRPGEDVERARKKLMQSAPYAVDVLEELMETAQSEPVRLKASAEILDRAGVRSGMEIDLGVEVKDARSPAEIVQERLAKLQSAALTTAALMPQNTEIQDAEVVEEEDGEDNEE